MRFYLVAFLVILALWIAQAKPVKPHPISGQLPEPIQSEPLDEASWRVGGTTFVPLADYDITARVLGIESYRFDEGAEHSPYDFALGWGRMSDYKIAERINLRQGNRWYYYSWGREGPPLRAEVIARSSANTHLIPASEAIKDELAKVSRGDIVRMTGQLVRLDKGGGREWISSLSRNDTGRGSCEILWVSHIEINNVH